MEGKKGLFVMGQPRRTWSVATVSLRLAVLPRFHKLKTCQKHLFWHFRWSRMIFEKVIFLHTVDLVDPFWHPPLWATSCSLPQPTGPRYGGLGVG